MYTIYYQNKYTGFMLVSDCVKYGYNNETQEYTEHNEKNELTYSRKLKHFKRVKILEWE